MRFAQLGGGRHAIGGPQRTIASLVPDAIDLAIGLATKGHSGPAVGRGRFAGSYALAVVEILTSRVLLRPTDLGRSLRFYEQTIGLAIYREWGTGPARGVVFFLGGGGLLEISGTKP